MTHRRYLRERKIRNRVRHLPPAHRTLAFTLDRQERHRPGTIVTRIARVFSGAHPLLMNPAHWMLPPDVDATDETFLAQDQAKDGK